jgi:hypothetical protein
MATATQRAEDADKTAGMGEVSLGQKMLSAVSGSILTSLLGMQHQSPIILAFAAAAAFRPREPRHDCTAPYARKC